MHTLTTLLLLLTSQAAVPSGDPADFWWGDYDGDGLQDALAYTPAAGTRLLRNEGDGTLVDVTLEAGLASLFRPGFALWADHDADGDLDLYVGSPRSPGRLFDNRGGSFVDVTAISGLERLRGDGTGEWIDFDGDGLLDLHLSGPAGHGLFRNLADAGFTPVVVPLDVRESAGFGVVASGGEEPAPTPATGAPDQEPSGSGGPAGGGGESPLGGNTGPTINAAPGNPAMNILQCAEGLLDQGGSGCLEASSIPQLGRLYPLSDDLYITTWGNVGIGTTTPLPGTRLDVKGTTRSEIFSSSLSGTESSPVFTLGETGTGMFFPDTDTLAMSTNGTERLRIDDQGRVGIGVLNPNIQYMLEVWGPIITISNITANAIGIGTDTPSNELHIRDVNSAVIRLEADTDNLGEGDQPQILFSQDGGVVNGRVGYFQSSNNLRLESLYDCANMEFKIRHVNGCPNVWEFINQAPPLSPNVRARFTSIGHLQIDGSVSSPAADLAEIYPTAGAVEPGDVVAFSGDGSTITRAQAGDGARLAGVVSSQPAFIMGLSYTDESATGVPFSDVVDADRFGGDTTPYRVSREVLHEIQVNGRAPLALAGRVPVKITAENGAVQPGDLLTLSSIPGHAMRATETGLTIGTALESWTTGEGKLLAFVRTGWYAPGADAGTVAAMRQELDDLRALVGSELAAIRAELDASAR